MARAKLKVYKGQNHSLEDWRDAVDYVASDTTHNICKAAAKFHVQRDTLRN